MKGGAGREEGRTEGTFKTDGVNLTREDNRRVKVIVTRSEYVCVVYFMSGKVKRSTKFLALWAR